MSTETAIGFNWGTSSRSSCDVVSQQYGILCDTVSRPAAKPISRAPRVPSGEARTRIIEAAGRLLEERRFRELTVEDVMAESGLARTVFYRHFDGLPAIVLGLLEDLLEAVVAEADQDPTDREMLRRQLALVVATFREHGRLLLALDDAARSDAAVEHAYRDWLDHAIDVSAELIERGVARGHTPPMPVRDVTRALTQMNANYLLDLVARDEEFDPDVAVEALWTVWARTTWP
jgi:AcrR family transcriptional regulator